MPKAIWKGQVIAESEDVRVLEGNYYFPPDSIRREFLKPSETTSHCPWKGIASYYTIEVDGQVNHDAAWFYHEPRDAAMDIKDFVSFWRGVEVQV